MTKPRQIVIFGASGNLTRRKLLPALARIAFAVRVDPGLQIIGMSRQPMRDEEFREQLAAGLSPERRKELEALAPAIHYQPGDVADPDSLVALGERLDVSPIPPRRVASCICHSNRICSRLRFPRSTRPACSMRMTVTRSRTDAS